MGHQQLSSIMTLVILSMPTDRTTVGTYRTKQLLSSSFEDLSGAPTFWVSAPNRALRDLTPFMDLALKHQEMLTLIAY